ncbi:MAG: hypothetical protein ACRDU0_01865 [Mycobacterium sp.]
MAQYRPLPRGRIALLGDSEFNDANRQAGTASDRKTNASTTDYGSGADIPPRTTAAGSP